MHVIYLDDGAKWVFDAIFSRDDTGVMVLGDTIDGLNRLIARGDFDYIDRVLSAIPTTTASRHILLAIARATFPIRQKLARWKPFVLSVKDAFISRGLDADRMLKGLI